MPGRTPTGRRERESNVGGFDPKTFIEALGGIMVTFTPIPIDGVAQPSRQVMAIIESKVDSRFLDKGTILDFPVEGGYDGAPRMAAYFRTADVPDAIRGSTVTIAGQVHYIIEVFREVLADMGDSMTVVGLESEKVGVP